MRRVEDTENSDMIDVCRQMHANLSAQRSFGTCDAFKYMHVNKETALVVAQGPDNAAELTALVLVAS